MDIPIPPPPQEPKKAVVDYTLDNEVARPSAMEMDSASDITQGILTILPLLFLPLLTDFLHFSSADEDFMFGGLFAESSKPNKLEQRPEPMYIDKYDDDALDLAKSILLHTMNLRTPSHHHPSIASHHAIASIRITTTLIPSIHRGFPR